MILSFLLSLGFFAYIFLPKNYTHPFDFDNFDESVEDLDGKNDELEESLEDQYIISIKTKVYNKPVNRAFVDSFDQLQSVIDTGFPNMVKCCLVRFTATAENTKGHTLTMAKEKAKNFKKELNITLIIFLALSSLLMLFCWYFISCFCAVYKNTQIHLIKDTVISFGFSMITPFGIYILPGIFRLCALNAKKKDKEYMFKFSKILQWF